MDIEKRLAGHCNAERRRNANTNAHNVMLSFIFQQNVPRIRFPSSRHHINVISQLAGFFGSMTKEKVIQL